MSDTQFDQIVTELIIKPFDKTFLNDHIGNTSGEIISLRFFEILSASPLGPSLKKLLLRETKKNSFTVTQ